MAVAVPRCRIAVRLRCAPLLRGWSQLQSLQTLL